MKELMKTMTELAPEFGVQLNENAELEADVNDRLDRAGKLDEVDTVSFGLETDDGKIVKVYVAEKDADKFEEIMSKALGEVDDIEEAINLASKEVEIIDVEWPSDDTGESPDPETTDDGSDALDPKVFNKANANREADNLKPKLEHLSYGERRMNRLDEGIPGGVASRLNTPNQQLIIQAILELGIPEVVLDRSPYRATIIRNIREVAMGMQRNSSLKQALRVFVKRTVDVNGPEEESIKEALLTEGNADMFWSTMESLLRLLDKSRKGLDFENLTASGKYQTLKNRSASFLNSKVGSALKTKLNNLQQAITQVAPATEPVVESLSGDEVVGFITQMFNMADPSANKMLSANVLNSTPGKALLRRAKQSTATLPGAIKLKLDAVIKELGRLSNKGVVESMSLASIMKEAKGPALIGTYTKDGKNFKLWQDADYEYSLTGAQDSKGKFNPVEKWSDVACTAVKAKLKKSGYTNMKLKEAKDVIITNVITEEADLVITGDDSSVKLESKTATCEFIEENLERLVKALSNRESVNIKDTNNNTFIVSPRGRSAVLKQVGSTNRIELDAAQVNELLTVAAETKD